MQQSYSGYQKSFDLLQRTLRNPQKKPKGKGTASGLSSEHEKSRKEDQKEYYAGRLALKTMDGRYVGTTKNGKLLCLKAKSGGKGVPPPRMFLFRVFRRQAEFALTRRAACEEGSDGRLGLALDVLGHQVLPFLVRVSSLQP